MAVFPVAGLSEHLLSSITPAHAGRRHEHGARPCARQVVGLFPFLAVDRASAVQRAAAAGARAPRLMGALGAAAGRLPRSVARWAPRRLAGARISQQCSNTIIRKCNITISKAGARRHR